LSVKNVKRNLKVVRFKVFFWIDSQTKAESCSLKKSWPGTIRGRSEENESIKKYDVENLSYHLLSLPILRSFV
jgi:hypothetical protein